MSSFEWTDEVTVGFTSVTVLVSTGCFRITVKINCSFLWHFFFWCLNHAYAIFVCVWIGLLCFQPLNKWNSENYLYSIHKHGGKRLLGNTYIRARSFYLSKRGSPLTHTGHQKITNPQLLWMAWHWHWIYDIWRKTIQRTLTKYESGALVTEWNVTTWYIFSICPGQLNNTDIDCPLVPWSEPIQNDSLLDITEWP